MTIQTHFGCTPDVKFGFWDWGKKDKTTKEKAAKGAASKAQVLTQDQLELINKIQGDKSNQKVLAELGERFKKNPKETMAALIQMIRTGKSAEGKFLYPNFTLSGKQVEEFGRALFKIKPPQGFIDRIIAFFMNLMPGFIRKLFIKK